MLDGLAIVIERMETHPEEFMAHDGRWDFLIDHNAYDIFTEEECVALEKAKVKLEETKKEYRRKNYTEKVLNILTADEENRRRIERKHQQEQIKQIISAGVNSMEAKSPYNWGEVLKDDRS